MNGAAPTRLIVFDCDGTLVDSQHHIAATMAEAFVASGLPAPSSGAVRNIIGLSLSEAIARLHPSGTEQAIATIEHSYKQAFFIRRQRPDHHEPLFPGAAECLDDLRSLGYALGVATGKARRGLEATLGSHGLLDRFVTLQTADRAPGKPDPTMLRWAMEEAGAEPENTLLIGDTTFDIEMANKAGVAGIGVSWGYHPRELLSAAGAVVVLDRFSDLAHNAARFMGGRP